MNTLLLAAAAPAAATRFHLSPVDMAVIAIYFVLVLGIGVYLKKFAKTGEGFFMAGREMTAWIAGLSFLAANLGSLELLGWAGSAYQYGILATHWYWIGAIPAMLFLGLVMMPFYYICKTHSVPGYLHLRYNNATRVFSGITFAVMTVLTSGINMYAMALVMKVFLGWDINFSIWVSAITVAVYVGLGGLLSAIFNEVLQFMLIWLGALLIPILGLIETHGWSGMVARIHENFPGQDYTHLWAGLGHFKDNPMGINWVGIVIGLGMIISPGYWMTNFLVVQRVLTAKDLHSAKSAPIIGAGFKMMIPIIVIVPGLLGLALLQTHLVPEQVAVKTGGNSYNEVLPLLMGRYLGPGLLGLGITALVAGFMSGMAGNVSAFATVWTYDIYRPLIRKQASDDHYVSVGRWCIFLGVLISIGAAYFVMQFESIMDYVQALFSWFVAPLLATVLFGMFWKRTTGPAGFWGLLIGTLTSIGLWVWVKIVPPALAYVALSKDAKGLAQDMFQALWSFVVTVIVTVLVSLATKPKPESELVGLVRGCTDIPVVHGIPWYRKPLFWGTVVFIVFIILNIIFW
jgi:solute:Na+ symporter, SSS family